jgi:hypothetical protein
MFAPRVVLATGSVLLLSGCGDDTSSLYCAHKGRDFFEQSVAAYFIQHPPLPDQHLIKVLEGASYDTKTNWWIVPAEVGPLKWNALLSCDGHLELSGRT